MSQWYEDETWYITMFLHRKECARNYDYGWWSGLLCGLLLGVAACACAVMWSAAK